MSSCPWGSFGSWPLAFYVWWACFFYVILSLRFIWFVTSSILCAVVPCCSGQLRCQAVFFCYCPEGCWCSILLRQSRCDVGFCSSDVGSALGYAVLLSSGFFLLSRWLLCSAGCSGWSGSVSLGSVLGGVLLCVCWSLCGWPAYLTQWGWLWRFWWEIFLPKVAGGMLFGCVITGSVWC
jgi:hypothetical protein